MGPDVEGLTPDCLTFNEVEPLRNKDLSLPLPRQPRLEKDPIGWALDMGAGHTPEPLALRLVQRVTHSVGASEESSGPWRRALDRRRASAASQGLKEVSL